jgi:hypothetical protein
MAASVVENDSKHVPWNKGRIVGAKPPPGCLFLPGSLQIAPNATAPVDSARPAFWTLTAQLGSIAVTHMGTVSDSFTSAGDLSPLTTMKWRDGVHDWVTYVTGEIPVGGLRSGAGGSPTSIGHGAIDGGGYTYFNSVTGHEFSGVAGFTYNLKNPLTQYQSGVDFHLDKLGTRSMASGEIRLSGAEAYLIGERGRGFNQMADMINNSRLSNAMRAAALMHRSVTEAMFIARRRSAFGRRLIKRE